MPNLEQAGRLALLKESRDARGKTSRTIPALFKLPRQAVSLIELSWWTVN